MTDAVYETSLRDLPLLFRGKVRDVYDLDDHLLIVASDRVSAFDVILPDPIPGKGKVLTALTLFWLERFKNVVPSHQTSIAIEDVVSREDEREQLVGRSMVVKKSQPLPIECVVRGYLLGSGYKDYKKDQAVCGVPLPEGLQLAEKLPDAIFTPASKAEVGDHDENIDLKTVINKVGADLAEEVREISLQLYTEASLHAAKRGIIIADTKFEFGLREGKLLLIDEVLTPDSSRFWAKDSYQVGMSPPSFDKQIIRDYLETLDWNKKTPGPHLPAEIMKKAAARYQEVLKILTN